MTVAAVPEVSLLLARYKDGGRSKLTMEARCRMCLVPRRRRGARQLQRHHLVPQRWFREKMSRFSQPGPFFDMDEWTRLWKLRDAEANIVPLCARCHNAVETDEAARAMLRKVLAPSEAAFVCAVSGDEWFDERYPRLRPAQQGYGDEPDASAVALLRD